MTSETFDKATTLILVALESELPKADVPGWNVQYIGVGKVNASLGICHYFQQFNPRTVINFGTAGAVRDGLSGLVEATDFYQRDMDATPMGFKFGQTPFEDALSISLDRPGLTCGTGDSFVTETPSLITDIVDMEAFALAKFAKQTGVDFRCFKYISDSADKNAPNEWENTVHRSSNLFINQVLK